MRSHLSRFLVLASFLSAAPAMADYPVGKYDCNSKVDIDRMEITSEGQVLLNDIPLKTEGDHWDAGIWKPGGLLGGKVRILKIVVLDSPGHLQVIHGEAGEDDPHGFLCYLKKD